MHTESITEGETVFKMIIFVIEYVSNPMSELEQRRTRLTANVQEKVNVSYGHG